MAEGIRTPNLNLGTTITEFVGNEEITPGFPQTVRVPLDVVAAQMVDDGPIADAFETLEAGQQAGAVAYELQSELFADLAHTPGAKGQVYGDPDPLKVGTYSKLGGSGVGSWVRIGDLDGLTAADAEETIAREISDKAVTPYGFGVAVAPVERQAFGTIDEPVVFEDEFFADVQETIGDDGVTPEIVGGTSEDGTHLPHIAPYDFKPFEVYVSPTNVEVGAMLAYGVGAQSDLGTILHAPEPYLKRRIRAILTDFEGNNFPVILDPFNDFAISLHTTIKEMEIVVYWGQSNALGPTLSVPLEVGPQVGTAALQGNPQNLIAVGGEDETTVIADDDFQTDIEIGPGFTNLHNTTLERPAVSFGNALVRRRYRSRILDQRRVIFTVGKGGKSITGAESIGPGSIQYDNIVEAMRRIRLLAIRDFGCNRFRVRMVTVHGEEDAAMGVATYKGHMQQLFDDFEADMDDIFNDDLTIPTELVGPCRFYMVQDSFIRATGHGGDPAIANVELHDGDKYILATTGYDATFGDDIHRDGPGNQHVHEKVAMAFAYREYRGLEWPLLVPGAVSYNAGTRTVSFSFPASPEGTLVHSDQAEADDLPAVADGRLGINIVRASALTTKLVTDSVTVVNGVATVVMTTPLIAATAYIVKIGRFRPEVTPASARPPFEGTWTNLRAESAEVSTGGNNNGRLQHYYVPQSETPFTTPA